MLFNLSLFTSIIVVTICVVLATTSKDLQEWSFMEWNFKNEYYNKMLNHPQRTEWQMMFRTRQLSAMLLKAQNYQKSKQMMLEVCTDVS